MSKGYKVIYIDEMCSTRSTYPKLEWTPTNMRFVVDRRSQFNDTIATVAAISHDGGLELAHHHERSINAPKFKAFIEELRVLNKNKRIVLFMDQLGVHRSKMVTKTMKRLHLKVIFNAAYSPQFNPIEMAFADVKRMIKVGRIKALANELKVTNLSLI